MGKFRAAAVHLALAAMLLRALLPAGWMPAAGDGAASALVICTMDGPVTVPADGKHSPDDGQHSHDGVGHDECPFAAAPHIAPPLHDVALAAPPMQVAHLIPSFRATAFAAARPGHRPHSPRAPPLTV